MARSAATTGAGAVTTAALADGAVTAAKVATVVCLAADHLYQSHPGDQRLVRLAGGGGGERPGAHRRVSDDTGATNAGAAYLFSTDGTLLTTFTNPTPADNDQFG